MRLVIFCVAKPPTRRNDSGQHLAVGFSSACSRQQVLASRDQTLLCPFALSAPHPHRVPVITADDIM
eukprot:1245318-Amphidinium_carterae.1